MNKYLENLDLNMRRAVSGEKVENFHTITFSKEDNRNGFRIYFYFKTKPTEEDLETASVIETSIYADYPDLYDMKTSYVEWENRDPNLDTERILWENEK